MSTTRVAAPSCQQTAVPQILPDATHGCIIRRLPAVGGTPTDGRPVMSAEALHRALDAWITGLPDPACTCFLKHRNTDGPVEVIDWQCALHGDTTP